MNNRVSGEHRIVAFAKTHIHEVVGDGSGSQSIAQLPPFSNIEHISRGIRGHRSSDARGSVGHSPAFVPTPAQGS